MSHHRVCLVLVLLIYSIYAVSLKWKGASMQADPAAASLDALQYANGNCIRIYGHWRYVQPKIDKVDPTLRVEQLRDLFNKNISALDEWSARELNFVSVSYKTNFLLIFFVAKLESC